MSKLIAIITLVSLSGIAAADDGGDRDTHRFGDTPEHSFHERDNDRPFQAPEIDPSSAMSAMTLLFGGLAVLRGRIAKK